jgi:hypothetical protein
VATLVAVGLTVGGFVHYQESRSALRAAFLPADASWVDAAAGEAPVTLLITPRTTRADVHTTLFWNRSVDSLVLLGDAGRPDAFASPQVDADAAGRLDLPAGLVLADRHGSTTLFRDAQRVAEGPTKTLWRTASAPQLELLLVGRYYSGLLAAEGGMRAWPSTPGGRISGRLELALTVPGGTAPVPFAVKLPDGGRFERMIEPGAARLVRIPVCSQGPWKASYATGTFALVHGTRVGLTASEPRLVDDPAAC